MKHTPTPWILIGNNTLLSIMRGGMRVCSFKRLAHNWDEQKANADFVLKAANLHDRLLAAVKSLRSFSEDYQGYNDFSEYDALIKEAEDGA